MRGKYLKRPEVQHFLTEGGAYFIWNCQRNWERFREQWVRIRWVGFGRHGWVGPYYSMTQKDASITSTLIFHCMILDPLVCGSAVFHWGTDCMVLNDCSFECMGKTSIYSPSLMSLEKKVVNHLFLTSAVLMVDSLNKMFWCGSSDCKGKAWCLWTPLMLK